MADKKLFFKHNILVEPLFNQWYAWPYLIPPASAAMYIANSHLKIMQSFVSAPQVHVSALKNPAMIGGSFINYDPSKAPRSEEHTSELQSLRHIVCRLLFEYTQ